MKRNPLLIGDPPADQHAELKADRDRFAALAHCASDVLLELDTDLSIVFAGGATSSLIGRDPQDLVRLRRLQWSRRARYHQPDVETARTSRPVDLVGQCIFEVTVLDPGVHQPQHRPADLRKRVARLEVRGGHQRPHVRSSVRSGR